MTTKLTKILVIHFLLLNLTTPKSYKKQPQEEQISEEEPSTLPPRPHAVNIPPKIQNPDTLLWAGSPSARHDDGRSLSARNKPYLSKNLTP